MSATISPSRTIDRFVCAASFFSDATISGNCSALSFPLRVMSLTSELVAKATTRMPSYFGSKVQPSPGISVPMLQYIGSREATESSVDAAVALEPPDFFRLRTEAGLASGDELTRESVFGSRLLCHTRLLPDAI